MTVICINDSWNPDPRFPHLINYGPSVGDFCKVIRVVFVPHINEDFYELENYEPGQGYLSTCFAPLSDIDETTFNRNYNEKENH